jgi:hypothetical protein
MWGGFTESICCTAAQEEVTTTLLTPGLKSVIVTDTLA